MFRCEAEGAEDRSGPYDLKDTHQRWRLVQRDRSLQTAGWIAGMPIRAAVLRASFDGAWGRLRGEITYPCAIPRRAAHRAHYSWRDESRVHAAASRSATHAAERRRSRHREAIRIIAVLDVHVRRIRPVR